MQPYAELYINGYLVDMNADDDPVQLTFQVNDLADIQSLNGNFTKSFKLPLTQRNRAILGFPDDITITTDTPYTLLAAKLKIMGIEVIANGLLQIIDVQNGNADVTTVSGNFDFLSRIGYQIYDMADSTSQATNFGTNLVWNQYDMPFPNDPSNLANAIWDVAHAANSQKKTSGWIFPIVNYGDIDDTPPYTGIINVRNLRPGFFLHSAIELLIQSTGYTINQQQSVIYNDPTYANLYQKGIIMFSNSDWEHSTNWQNIPDNEGVTLSKGQDQIISKPRIFNQPQTTIYNNDNPFSTVIDFGPSDHYIAISNVDFTATLTFDLFMRGRQGGKQPSEVIVKFTIVNTDGSIIDADANMLFTLQGNTTYVTGNGNSKICQTTFRNQKLSSDFGFVKGMQLYVRLHMNNIGTNISSDTYCIFKAGAQLAIVTNEKLVLWQQPFQCERLLPDVSQLDFLKDTLQRFGLILIADPNTASVIFTSFKVIVNNIPKAKDWTSKCLDMGDQINFQLGNYCQINKLKYQDDNTIPVNYMSKYYFDDKIVINDKSLNLNQISQDLFTSIFAPTINRPYLGGTIAQMSDPTDTNAFSAPGSPRILIDQKLDISALSAGGNPINITFQDTDAAYLPSESVVINDILSVPYFYKPDAPDLSPAPCHLGWSDKRGVGVNFSGQQKILPGLQSVYYPEIERILTRTKKVIRYFNLTPQDILELDYQIPIYNQYDGAYFAINKIDSWVAGIPTKVELIRL